MSEERTRAHVLKPLSGATMPRYMVFVDTETTQDRSVANTIYQDLRLGVGIAWIRRDEEKETKLDIFRFTTAIQFWEWAQGYCIEGEILHIMAHNAVFDMTVLQHIDHLTRLGYKCQFVFDNAMTFIGKWVMDGHSIEILNTANWFQGSVAKWGEALGLDKLEMPDDDKTQEDWFVYCERDTMILVELVKWYIAFLRDNDLGSWKYTIASQAFTAFRHKFMRHKIHVPDDKEETRIARAAYKGGRTEVFKVGDFTNGPYYKIDVNSMYPFVMSTHDYPSRLKCVGNTLSEGQLRYSRGKYAFIIEATVCTDKPYFVEDSTGRNVYPVGTFRTFLTTEELYIAFDNNWLKEIHSYACYYKRPLFKSYVDFFYKQKVRYTEEGATLQRAFTKLYLNSLYGKFGQRGYKDEIIGEVEIPGLAVWYAIDVTTGSHYLYRLMGHTLIRSTQEGESFNSFVAIAAHVTANARLLLYSTIERIGREHCYYSDTDSIIVDKEGFETIKGDMHSTKLGAWALEGISDRVCIEAPKHYWFDGKWTMKGVRKGAKKIGENTYRQEQWPGLSTVLKSGKERYFNKIVQKTLSPDIQTGAVLHNGDVIPLVMGHDNVYMAPYAGAHG